MKIMKIIRNKNKIFMIGLIAALLAVPSAISVMAAPGDNIALNATVESCGYVNNEEMDSFLVDNDPDYSTKWCCIDGANHSDGYHWIILDFGTEKTFDSVRLVKASEGDRDFGQTQYDASAFRFEAVDGSRTQVLEIKSVSNNEKTSIFEGSFEPVTARYLRLTVLSPEADPDNHTAAVRLYDLKVFESAVPVTSEDAAYALIEELQLPPDRSIPLPPRTGIVTASLIIYAVGAVGVINITRSRKCR